MKPISWFAQLLLDAWLILPATIAPTHASTLSKAVRTSDSMEPGLSFPEQEQAAAEHRLACDRRYGLG